jgi:hypothetical protein
MSGSNTHDTDPVIRIWGGHRESDWNEYWTMDRVMRQRAQLATILKDCGVNEIDICPALRLRAPVSPHRLEIFLPNAEWPSETWVVCDEIQKLTGRRAVPMDVETDAAFRILVAERLLYLRQEFELWDEVLPRFILGVDFDSGRHVRLRPAEPGKWRLVDHVVDGSYADRRILQALLLDPSEKGSRLLAELKSEFDDWYKQDFRGRPPLNAILDYRHVLERYGVDCNESFRYGLADGWFPIDVEEDRNWNAARELCTMPLPDNPGDLLRDEDNKPVGKYGAIFFFVALTDNSS